MTSNPWYLSEKERTAEERPRTKENKKTTTYLKNAKLGTIVTKSKVISLHVALDLFIDDNH